MVTPAGLDLSTIDEVPVVPALCDGGGRFVEISDGPAAILGRSAADVVGMPYAEIVHPDDRPAVGAAFRVFLHRTMTLRVFLVDDNELIRVGLRTLMEAEPDLEVVGEAATAGEAVGRIAAARPDIAVVDVQLGPASGIEVCRDVRSRCPEVRCLVLSGFYDERNVTAAILAGAAGYVLRHRASKDLIHTIRAIAQGGMVLDPALAHDAVATLRARSGPEELLERLSAQERRILEHIAAGRTNREIAEEVSLAEKTVRNYVSNLLAKLGMHRRSEAAAFAARLEERREFGPRP